jgi:hypothetical protein
VHTLSKLAAPPQVNVVSKPPPFGAQRWTLLPSQLIAFGVHESAAHTPAALQCSASSHCKSSVQALSAQ